MTQSSSLPVWAIVLIMGMIALFILGYFSPYVPKSVKLMLSKHYDTDDWSTPRPTVLVRDHISPTLAVVIAVLVPIASLIVFVVMDSWRLIQHFGGGFFWSLVVYVAAFFAYGVSVIVCMMLYVSANYLATREIRRHYERHYGAKIIIESLNK